MKWLAQGETEPPTPLLKQWAAQPPQGAGLQVTLRAMEIRSFIVSF